MQKSALTEIEKLGPKFKDLIARSLVTGVLMVGVGAPLAITSEVFQYHNKEKTEAAQLVKDARGADQLSAQIIKNSGNQKATDFFILKSALQDEKNAIDDAIKNASALSKMLGLQENREFRSSQYQHLIDNVQYRIEELEAKGQKPLDHLKDRNQPAQLKAVDNDYTTEQPALKL